MASLKKNVASQNVTCCLVSATTFGAVTGASPTVYVTKDGTQAASAGAVTELKVSGTGHGAYNYAPTQAETNATDVGFLIINAGSIPVNLDFHTDVVDANGLLEVDVSYINAVATSSVTTVGSYQGATGDAYTLLGTPANGTVSADIASVDIDVSNGLLSVGNNIISLEGDVASLSGSLASISTVCGTIETRLGVPTNASISADIASVKTSIGSVTGSVASVTAPVSVTSNIKKNAALSHFEFVMLDSTTHIPKTGLTVSGTRNIDGAGFAACANAVTEVANGWYTIDLAASDMDGNVIALRFTAAGADDRNLEIITQP